MHIRIGIFVQRHHQAGEVDLPSHLEIKEVAIDIDTTLHQVVVDDGRGKIFHKITASTINIERAIKTHIAFKIIEVKACQVHFYLRTELRYFIFLEKM